MLSGCGAISSFPGSHSISTDRHPLLLLGVTGSIAAYKSAEILRLLVSRADLNVRVLMTPAASHFVGALTFEALSGAPVFDAPLAWSGSSKTSRSARAEVVTMEGADVSSGITHTDLTADADALLVAPATADILAKLAHGLGDDPVSVTALALRSDAALILAPAMNPRMWANAAVQENVATLIRRGAHVIGPASGEMACRDHGTGRMSEPEEIAAITRRILSMARDRREKRRPRRAVILSGPTREPLDDVRFLSNGSSGRMGAALAAAAFERGDEVTVISGPAAVLPDPWITTIHVETAAAMLEAARSLPCDLLISPAAISDWRPAERVPGKPAKSGDRTLMLMATPDILATLTADPNWAGRGAIVVAFAAESIDANESTVFVAAAGAKAQRKGAGWIVLNDARAVMGAMTASVKLIRVTPPSVQDFGPLPKVELARVLLQALDSSREQVSK